LKNIFASSDKRNMMKNNIPVEVLWRAAQMIRQKGMEVSPLDAEPAPLEMLGLSIGILRRRKRISRLEFSQKIGCSVEELLALEMGRLPVGDLAKYLPLIVREIKIPGYLLQPILGNMKLV
jgi:hypothetical protein